MENHDSGQINALLDDMHRKLTNFFARTHPDIEGTDDTGLVMKKLIALSVYARIMGMNEGGAEGGAAGSNERAISGHERATERASQRSVHTQTDPDGGMNALRVRLDRIENLLSVYRELIRGVIREIKQLQDDGVHNTRILSNQISGLRKDIKEWNEWYTSWNWKTCGAASK